MFVAEELSRIFLLQGRINHWANVRGLALEYQNTPLLFLCF